MVSLVNSLKRTNIICFLPHSFFLSKMNRKTLSGFFRTPSGNNLYPKLRPGVVFETLVGVAFVLMCSYGLSSYAHSYFQRDEPQNFEKLSTVTHRCGFTKQGKIMVADDKGSVCKWNDLDPTSRCCKLGAATTITQSTACSRCSSLFCCDEFEHCVSCCLSPNSEKARHMRISEEVKYRIPEVLQGSIFEQCTSICRYEHSNILAPSHSL